MDECSLHECVNRFDFTSLRGELIPIGNGSREKGIFVIVFSSLYVYEGWAECRVTSGVMC